MMRDGETASAVRRIVEDRSKSAFSYAHPAPVRRLLDHIRALPDRPWEKASRGASVREPASKSKLRSIGSAPAHAVKWTTWGALIGGACGSLYGLPFAGWVALLDDSAGRIAVTVLYFTLGGAVAGVLVGLFGAVIGGEADSLPDDSQRGVEMTVRYVRLVGEPATSRRRQLVNRLARISSVNRQRIESAASRNPSRN